MARRVGIFISSKNLPTLASYVLATAWPTFSALPRRGSRIWNARNAHSRPGTAAKKKAVRQPKWSAT